ncbi:MAG TPA: hypothetical protein VKR52_05420 [Terracidiphilus sp.]|nr:hypothetical protein [Terracidiphilus sp.]
MSEKIYACLLKLFPSRFRREYQREALQLFRDRLRDERGIARRLRLCVDLVTDLIIGLPLAYQNSFSAGSEPSLAPNGPGALPFQVLHNDPLRPGAILLGTVLAFSAILTFSWVMGRDIGERLTPPNQLTSPIERVMQRLNQPQQLDTSTQTPAQAKASGTANVSSQTQANPQAHSRPPQESVRAQEPVPAGAPVAAPAQRLAISPASSRSSETASGSRLLSTGADAIALRFAAGKSAASQPSRNGAVISVAPASDAFAPRAPTTAHYAAAAIAQTNPANAMPMSQPNVENATQAMVRLMRAHQVVMFGETHGNQQEYEWLCSLVKDPVFASQVDDIVVEFGNSLYQKTVDRYIAGGDVPQEQIEKAWRNVIGAVGPVSPVYGWFYKAVRDSNLQRPGGHKIRIVLGDPYGDWEKIHNAEDLGPYLAHRDEWYAQVVKDAVLAPHHRALLVMGAGHFLRRSGPGLVERAIRAAGVQPYLVVFGTNAVGAYADLDHRFDAWKAPAIVTLQGNWVGELPANPVLTGGVVAPNAQKMEDVADAMLYVGSRDTLTQVNVPPSGLLDTAYGKEVERRLQIQTGRTMEFTQPLEEPQFHRPLQQVSSNGVHLTPPNPPRSIHDQLPPRPPSQ